MQIWCERNFFGFIPIDLTIYPSMPPCICKIYSFVHPSMQSFTFHLCQMLWPSRMWKWSRCDVCPTGITYYLEGDRDVSGGMTFLGPCQRTIIRNVFTWFLKESPLGFEPQLPTVVNCLILSPLLAFLYLFHSSFFLILASLEYHPYTLLISNFLVTFTQGPAFDRTQFLYLIQNNNFYRW